MKALVTDAAATPLLASPASGLLCLAAAAGLHAVTHAAGAVLRKSAAAGKGHNPLTGVLG